MFVENKVHEICTEIKVLSKNEKQLILKSLRWCSNFCRGKTQPTLHSKPQFLSAFKRDLSPRFDSLGDWRASNTSIKVMISWGETSLCRRASSSRSLLRLRASACWRATTSGSRSIQEMYHPFSVSSATTLPALPKYNMKFVSVGHLKEEESIQCSANQGFKGSVFTWLSSCEYGAYPRCIPYKRDWHVCALYYDDAKVSPESKLRTPVSTLITEVRKVKGARSGSGILSQSPLHHSAGILRKDTHLAKMTLTSLVALESVFVAALFLTHLTIPTKLLEPLCFNSV